MSLFKRRSSVKNAPPQPWKIRQDCLALICECAKDEYPHEFGGLLRVDPLDKHLISELVILPGTVSGDAHTLFQMHMRPLDFSIVGTVHSHPSSSPFPSRADLQFFQKYGRVHIIAAYPYSFSSWRAYYASGEGMTLEVV
jgi:proteasome lid subunit RPN8/RPN11